MAERREEEGIEGEIKIEIKGWSCKGGGKKWWRRRKEGGERECAKKSEIQLL